MLDSSVWVALLGGALIGVAVTLLLWANGKVAGISGIVGGLLGGGQRSEMGWRAAFVVGLLSAGALAVAIDPAAHHNGLGRSLPAVLVAGLLVGVGTRLGSGCTSGHGVCGLGRLSPRSLIATLTFTGAGALVVAAVGRMFGGTL